MQFTEFHGNRIGEYVSSKLICCPFQHEEHGMMMTIMKMRARQRFSLVGLLTRTIRQTCMSCSGGDRHGARL